MKVIVAQLNPIVGDLDGNTDKIIKAYDAGVLEGADLVVLPECMLTGYPLEDLVMRPTFLNAVTERVARIWDHVTTNHLVAGPTLIFGAPTRAVNPSGPRVGVARNSAFIMNGALQHERKIDKVELPNYGVFDELRTFQMAQSAGAPVVVQTADGPVNVGVMICEDCWHPRVSEELVAQGAEFLIAINGSPYEIGKNAVRHQVIEQRIRETGKPFLYVNMVGGQDELVFDGGSFAYDGEFHAAPFFEETTFLWDFEVPQSVSLDAYPEIAPSSIASIYQATVLGLRDYMGKQGFKKVVLGMSGGVDSGIVAAIAADAIGPDNVDLVRLPSKFSSDHSLSDAEEAAQRLGSPIRTIPIEGVVEALRTAYRSQERHNYQSPTIHDLTGIADENIQARARGNILMSISNQEGQLLLSTGNRTETSVGYSTLYGDMSGGFNPIKDCYKTTVWDMCRWRNSLTEGELLKYGFLGRAVDVVPEEIINKPPSAELRPDQKDEDSLPPYPVLDDILKLMLEYELSNSEIVAYRKAPVETPHDIDVVKRVRGLVDRAEYKRRQGCPGVKITNNSFGRDRRYPIVNRYGGE